MAEVKNVSWGALLACEQAVRPDHTPKYGVARVSPTKDTKWEQRRCPFSVAHHFTRQHGSVESP